MSEEIRLHWPGPDDPLGRAIAWEEIEALIDRTDGAFSIVVTREGEEPKEFYFPARQEVTPAARARLRRHRRRRRR